MHYSFRSVRGWMNNVLNQAMSCSSRGKLHPFFKTILQNKGLFNIREEKKIQFTSQYVWMIPNIDVIIQCSEIHTININIFCSYSFFSKRPPPSVHHMYHWSLWEYAEHIWSSHHTWWGKMWMNCVKSVSLTRMEINRNTQKSKGTFHVYPAGKLLQRWQERKKKNQLKIASKFPL